MEELLLKPKCPVCNLEMDYLETVTRKGYKLKIYTCFQDRKFKALECSVRKNFKRNRLRKMGLSREGETA